MKDNRGIASPTLQSPTTSGQTSPAPEVRKKRGSARWWLLLIIVVIGVPIAYWLQDRQRNDAIETYHRQSRSASAKSDWKTLAKSAEGWSKLEPERAEPWLYRAEAAEELKDWPNFVQYIDHIPHSDRRCVPALIKKAIAEFENLNHPRDGVKTCEEVLRLEPRVLVAHKQLIFFSAMTLQRAEMVHRIRDAVRVRRESPESYVYLVGTSWLYPGSLFHHNSRWLEAAPGDETFEVAQAMEVYVSNAKTDLEHAFEFEHIPEAVDLLKKYPHNLELVAYFVDRNITGGDLEKVQELLKLVPAEVADRDARFWRARAWVQDANGEFEAAEHSLRKAYEADPYWWQVHFQLHDLARRLGRLDDSAKFFKMYKISKDLSIQIKTLNGSIEKLDDQKFCRSLLELAELVEDNEIVTALKDRVSP